MELRESLRDIPSADLKTLLAVLTKAKASSHTLVRRSKLQQVMTEAAWDNIALFMSDFADFSDDHINVRLGDRLELAIALLEDCLCSDIPFATVCQLVQSGGKVPGIIAEVPSPPCDPLVLTSYTCCNRPQKPWEQPT